MASITDPINFSAELEELIQLTVEAISKGVRVDKGLLDEAIRGICSAAYCEGKLQGGFEVHTIYSTGKKPS